MQQGMRGSSGHSRWALRLSLWAGKSDVIGPAVMNLAQWFTLRQVFAVEDEGAFWKIAAVSIAAVAFVLVRAHLQVEKMVRFLESAGATGAGQAPSGQTTPYRTCGPMPAPDMVRREAVAPFMSTDTESLNAEMDARRAALAPLNAEETRLMRAVFASRCFEVGVLVPRDESPKDTPPAA